MIFFLISTFSFYLILQAIDYSYFKASRYKTNNKKSFERIQKIKIKFDNNSK